MARLLADHAGELDAAFIITPHAFHHDQVVACLEAGLDVLMEKPMTMNVREALSLIETRDRTGRVLMVAFPASLSARYRAAIAMRQAGEFGRLMGISATLWEGWGRRMPAPGGMMPEISGGGYLFDAGAHMVNAVAELAGEDFVEAAAWFDNNGRAVETRATVMCRTTSGALVTMHAMGEASHTAGADVHAFYSEATIHADAWGRRMAIQRRGEKIAAAARPARCADPLGAIPGRARRRDAESRPGGERAARGAAVGGDRGVGGRGRQAGEGVSVKRDT